MQNELITEHLGFSPVQFVDKVIEKVNFIMYKSLEKLERQLQSELLSCECSKVQLLMQGMSCIETLFENSVDKRFDRFELFCLSNIFCIPPGLPVLLDRYKGLNFDVTLHDETCLDKEMEQIRKKILSVYCFDLAKVYTY